MTGRQTATRAVPTVPVAPGAVITRERVRSAALPMACWAWTRGVLLLFTYNVVPYISHGDIVGDVKTYNRWSQSLAAGHYPLHDPQWQYPPGAAIVIALPRLIHSGTGLSYYTAFYAMALLADLITFLLVLYRCWFTAHRGDATRTDYTGAWAYVVAIFMLGPIVYGRYDIVVTMTAALALVVTTSKASGTWRLRGAAIGTGALMKLWPAALAVGLPKGADGRRAVRWAVLAAAAPTLALAAFLPGAFGFLSGQQDRGLEVESVLAVPFLIARRFGYPGVIRHQYGAFEIIGPGVGTAAIGCELLTVAGFAWLLWWRRRADLTPQRWSAALYYDAGLVAVLVAIVTSRVLSPQYLVWVVALIALCLTQPDSALRGPCWLLLAAISLTQAEFPLLFPRLLHGGRLAPWVLAGRDLMLVVATLWAAWALWRAVVPKRRAEAPDEPRGEAGEAPVSSLA
ncbi:DUF2029 domain-containing protein, partial [Actinocrinis puniceicyclus]